MRAILCFLAAGLIWGLLELYLGFTLKGELAWLVGLVRGGGI